MVKSFHKYNKYRKKSTEYKELVDKLKRVNYHTKYFHGGGIATQLICRSDKIIMLTILQNYVVDGYQTYLLHTRMGLTCTTISKHYY